MNISLSKIVMGTGLAATLALGAPQKPAQASQTGTVNTILGAAAAIGGIIIYNNIQHKRQAANRVVGYTRNGGTVYGDGRIAMPNGQIYYPNANGTYPWGQQAYYDPNASGYGYGDPNARRDDEEDGERHHGRHHDGHHGEHHGEHGEHHDEGDDD